MLCVFCLEKAVPEMTHTVSGGTLNPTHSLAVYGNPYTRRHLPVNASERAPCHNQSHRRSEGWKTELVLVVGYTEMLTVTNSGPDRL